MNRLFFGQMLVAGLGGFLGTAARFALSGLVQRAVPLSNFPFGTLVVNVTGCLAIGLVGGLIDARQVLTPPMRMFLLIGVLGGFTTFSTLAYETLRMAQASELLRASANAAAHLFLGFGAAWLGYLGARTL